MITINDTNKLHGKDRIYFRPLIQLISRVNHLLSANCGYEPVKLQFQECGKNATSRMDIPSKPWQVDCTVIYSGVSGQFNIS